MKYEFDVTMTVTRRAVMDYDGGQDPKDVMKMLIIELGFHQFAKYPHHPIDRIPEECDPTSIRIVDVT